VSNLRAFLELNPEKAAVGNTIYISGRITDEDNNAARDISANIHAGGKFVAGITTDQNGRFNTYFTPNSAGSYRVTVRNTDLQVSKTVYIGEKVKVSNLDVPTTVTKAETKACGTVSVFGQQNVELSLILDGNEISSKNAYLANQTEICFKLPNQNTGKHTLTLQATAGKQESSYSRDIKLEVPATNSGNDTNEDNRSITITSSVQRTNNTTTLSITLTNKLPHSRTITVRTSSGTTVERTVTINSSSETTTTVDLGNTSAASASVELLENNKTVGSQTVDLTAEQTEQSLLSSVGSFIDQQKYLLIFIGIIVLIYLIRNELKAIFQPSPLEPRQR